MIAQSNTAPLHVTSIKTANYVARSGELVQCDASGGSFTVTLPSSLRVNQIVGVKLLETTGGNAVTIARNGNAIEGEAGDFTLASTGEYLELQFDGGGTWLSRASSEGALGREVLTANRTYYVRTNGSDSNNGLTNTAGGAFLTVQKAIDTVASIDLAIYDVTIQIADGTYTGAVNVVGPWVGSGNVTVQGNTGAPANVLFNVSGTCITVQLGGRLNVAGIRFQSTANAVVTQAGGICRISGAVDFGACATFHLYASRQSVILISAARYQSAIGQFPCVAFFGRGFAAASRSPLPLDQLNQHVLTQTRSNDANA